MSINNVIICGLGAVGLTYAAKLKDKCCLKILIDSKRLERYRREKPSLNGVSLEFDYILPDDCFEADLIIISTKAQGLDSAIENIKNFVGEKTIILSLLNGISSEERIAAAYPSVAVLKSYFIGHSAVRTGNSVTQDGIGKIVAENNSEIIDFFTRVGVDYSTPDDINYSMWLKFTLNLFSNQVSAIMDMTFGDLKQNAAFIDFAKKIIAEVCEIASRRGVRGLENLEKDALHALSLMCDEGKTSMHQDILAGRKTEVEIFAGEIIRLGKVLGVATPYNQVLYDMIKIAEEKNEHRVYTC